MKSKTFLYSVVVHLLVAATLLFAAERKQARKATTVSMAEEGSAPDGHRVFAADAPILSAGRMGVNVRVVPRSRLVDTPLELGRVAWAG